MKKNLRKIVLRSLLCLFVAVAGYFSYEFVLKEFIYEYFRMQVVDRMKQNLENHEDDFEKLVEFSKDFNDVDGITFLKNDTIEFSIYSTTFTEANKGYMPIYESVTITEQNDSVFYHGFTHEDKYVVESIKFISDSLFIHTKKEGKDNLYVFDSWIIHYEGTEQNIIVEDLLSYRNIDFENFKLLRAKLKKLNCHYFFKSENVLMLHYSGYAPNDYFAYNINLNNSISIDKEFLLKNNYYWHYQPPSFCFEMTNWYGKGEVD